MSVHVYVRMAVSMEKLSLSSGKGITSQELACPSFLPSVLQPFSSFKHLVSVYLWSDYACVILLEQH